MAVQHRGAVLAGGEIVLRAAFSDDAGCLIDLDSPPSVYIYDETVADDVIHEEALAGTFTSAVAGPFVATRLSTGYYTYTYTVPTTATAGGWNDVWYGAINGTNDYDVFEFDVTTGFNVSEQQLGPNMLVVLQLDDSITNLTGEQALPATTLGYATTYNPLYASPDMIRLEMGKWIDYIPDSTLALMAHISSKEANFIHGARELSFGNLRFARSRFVVYDTVWRCLNIPGHGKQAGSSSGKRKSLGDLSITDGSSDTAEIPDEIYEYVREQRSEWFRVVNAGGNIVPGQGLAPTMAVKGAYDPDRRLVGRLWDSPTDRYYPQPTVNKKYRAAGRRRGRYGYDDERFRGVRRGSLYRNPYDPSRDD